MYYRVYVNKTEVARFRYISDAESMIDCYLASGYSVQVVVDKVTHNVTDAAAFVKQVTDAMIEDDDL